MTEQEKRKKVINGLKTIVDEMECEVAEWVNYSDSELNDGLTVDCDWWIDALGKCKDALELLKAQEPMEPEVKIYNGTDIFYKCPSCHKSFLYNKQKFCDDCGQAVKWNDD